MLTVFDQPSETLFHLDLSSNKLAVFQEQYLPQLLSLDLSFNTNLTTFTGNTLSKLKHLDLYLTSLSNFECGSMRNLSILDLSNWLYDAGYNKLTDSVVEQLARCNFLNIGQIVLSTYQLIQLATPSLIAPMSNSVCSDSTRTPPFISDSPYSLYSFETTMMAVARH